MNPHETFTFSKSAENQLFQSIRAEECGKSKHTGRDDRATSEQVLDPRTRMILFKLLNQPFLAELNGCLSTGKEANVYHARLVDGRESAIKIYKTSILVFKDREKYVTGEFRFRHGYCKRNPRKMVKVWAEKEMRNLRRLSSAGIDCPKPILLRSNVLVMDFIGGNGWPAPRLKDARLSLDEYRECYLSCVKIMRRMFQQCRLVHGDLSEYNLLYYRNCLFFIDVSQSVESDHPIAMNLLRQDCQNVTKYFTKQGISAMLIPELFDFVTNGALKGDEVDTYLQKKQDEIMSRPLTRLNADKVEEAVFMSSYIPRSLKDILHTEKEQIDYIEGRTEKTLADAISRLEVAPVAHESRRAEKLAELLLDDSDTSSEKGDEEPRTSDDELDDTDHLELDDSDPDLKCEQIAAFRAEKRLERERVKQQEKEEKKERKLLVKDENRVKRQSKIPKHVKKRHKRIAQQKGDR
uniref:Serine/threonine-protein kinase RIO1 n=1 Tax=Albugo laibachii Nc14 TaxID=890382 RepID=F0WFP0_9STRA|nr:Rio kinase putative [Albugo laibachii Nc14]|eukprot:CCA20022.1 Rio kinase putative [Albugo laibachii Nc14]